MLDPDAETIRSGREEERRRQAIAGELDRYLHLVSETVDGYAVRLSANIETARRTAGLLHHGARASACSAASSSIFRDRGCPPRSSSCATSPACWPMRPPIR